MIRFLLLSLMVVAALSLNAAERDFDFAKSPVNQTPEGFRSLVLGRGNPGEWKVIMTDVPPTLAPLTSKAPSVSQQAVLAQLDRNPADNHLPILLYDKESYDNFKITTRFKLVGGAMEQSAGLVFRFENESNFFAVQANGFGGTFRCLKVVNGQMKPPIGPQVEITRDTWHDLSVQCEGERIVCSLDGKELIKLVDHSSAGTVGKVGFLTWADSVAYFSDAKIIYQPREILAQTLVKNAIAEYSRLQELTIFAIRPGETNATIVASTDAKALGQPGSETEGDVIKHGKSYYRRDRGSATITAPLRDRNGDPIAAVRVTMKSFPGQTQENALIRAQPVIKKMEAGVLSLKELLN